MNRARQDAITTEIMEIVGGAEALSAGDEHPTPRPNPTTSPAPTSSTSRNGAVCTMTMTNRPAS